MNISFISKVKIVVFPIHVPSEQEMKVRKIRFGMGAYEACNYVVRLLSNL